MRAMILGVDAPIVPRVLKYVEQGDMPNLKSLIDGGVIAESCLVPFPTITPPNWATIVTGAWPGTHGISCFHNHTPGAPLDEAYPAFDSKDVKAEFIWEALARAGKKSIVLNYPTSWPPRGGDELTQVAGPGLAPNEWRLHPKRKTMWDVGNDICASQLFATEEYPRGTEVEPQTPEGWSSAPEGAAVQYELPLAFRSAIRDLEPVTWWGLVTKGADGPKLAIYPSREAADPICVLRPGEWSEKIQWQFATSKGPARGVLKIKLLELADDGREMKLFFTPICALDGYHQPESLAEELAALEPMPLSVYGVDELQLGWIDDETWEEIMVEAHHWMAQTADLLLSSKPWDLFAMHLHCPDWMYHAIATPLDPVTQPDAAVRERYEKIERKFHQAWDGMLGTILAHAKEDVLVSVVSDHGAKATGRHVPVNRILQDAGLLVVEDAGQGPKVVWDKTKAFPQRSSYVYVNLIGRDPDGCVKPEDYETVRDQIIEALLSYRDAERGLCPFSMVARREDTRPLGTYGQGSEENVGDIVFAVRGEFDGQHGDHLPTAKWGLGDIHGLLILKGPGIKAGDVLKRTAWITDLVPTICHMTEWPMPHQADGAVLYQALENPDAKAEELRRLRRNYANLKRAYGSETSLTHSYHDLGVESLEESEE